MEVEMVRTLSSVLLSCAFITTAMLVPNRSVAADWENLKISGGFRYRHEMINDETKDEVRHHHRIRARILLDASVNNQLSFGFGLASGTLRELLDGSDPISTNQTLGAGFTSKNIWLDRAYFDLRLSSLKGANIIGGKMTNPYYRIAKMGLIWDGDLRPEGLAVKYAHDSEQVGLFISTGAFWVIENSQDDDVMLLGGQGGVTFALGQAGITGGVGYFTFTNAADKLTDLSGNPLGMDFDELELFAEIKTKIAGHSATFAADYVVNTAAEEEDTGMLFGAMLGKKKKPGSWDLGIFYEKLKANAVFPAFTDSDFGNGGTNAKGLILGGGLRIMEKADLGVTYFVNTRHIAEGEEEADYHRLQVDFKFGI